MAGIGLYGVFYATTTITTGSVTQYGTWKQMGNAIDVSFTPAESSTNNLWSNNAITEVDVSQASGGDLSFTLDKLTAAAYSDLFGYTAASSSVTVNSTSVTGTGFDVKGTEQSNPVGVGFILWNQESNDRNKHEAVIFRNASFKPPALNGQTMGETVEWQTPEISGTVVGKEGDGTKPWMVTRTFPSQAAAEAFIKGYTA